MLVRDNVQISGVQFDLEACRKNFKTGVEITKERTRTIEEGKYEVENTRKRKENRKGEENNEKKENRWEGKKEKRELNKERKKERNIMHCFPVNNISLMRILAMDVGNNWI